MALLFVSPPLSSIASAEESGLTNSSTAEVEIEGVNYLVTLWSTETYSEVTLKNLSDNQVETASYNKTKDQMVFNNELVSQEALQEMKGIASSVDATSDIRLAFTDYSFSASTNDGYSTDGVGPTQPWKYVKSSYNAINVVLVTTLAVCGLILLLPTGTGFVAGVVISAKVLATLAIAIVSSVKNTGNRYVYTKLDTYYKYEMGYHKYKYVLSAYKDSARTKLISSVSHETRLGNKPPSSYGYHLYTPTPGYAY